MRMSWLSIVTALGAFVSAAMLPIACTDEGEAISGLGTEGSTAAAGPAAAAGSGGAGGGSGSSGTGGMSSASTAASTGSGTDGGGLPDGALEECLMTTMGDPCGTCACNNCLVDVVNCQMDMGCTEIRMCAQTNMCSGIDCLGPCGTIINMYGGVGGPSATLGLALSGCVDMNCMTECAPP